MIVRLSEAKVQEIERYKTRIFDKVLGGGLVKSAVVLIGGGPGAGKTTISLQMCDEISHSQKREVLYLMAEETAAQVKATATRLRIRNMERILTISARTVEQDIDFEGILKQYRPAVCVIDSVSKLYPNFDDQVEMCDTVKDFAARMLIPFVVLCHVNKAEELAGMKAMEHTVDASILFNKDESDIRIASVEKNRMGENCREFYDMTERGLVIISVCEECGHRSEECECDGDEEVE